MNSLPYLVAVDDQPAETYIERTIANLYNLLREHPEDALHLKHQILVYSHINEDEDKVIGLALELIAMDVDKIYADECIIALARMYAKKNDTLKAVEYYRQVLTNDPKSEDTIIELADLYKEQLDYDAAIAVYNYLDNDYFADIKGWRHRYQAFCYYNKREYEKALELFQTALAIDPDDEGENTMVNIGVCFLNMKNYTEAFVWFRKVLEKYPESADAYYGLGLCYQHTDDGYRALHHYFEAVKIKPDYTDAYNNIAAITINQDGDYKAGIEMLKKAIDICPDDKSLTLVYLNLTQLYKRLQEFALADYYKAEYMKSLGFDVSLEEDDEDE